MFDGLFQDDADSALSMEVESPRNPVRPKPGFFAGAGRAIPAGMTAGALRTGAAGLDLVQAYRHWHDFTRGVPQEHSLDKMFQDETDWAKAMRETARKTDPDPYTSGAAAQVIHGLSAFGTEMLVGASLAPLKAVPAFVGVVEGFTERGNLMSKGVKPETANLAGLAKGGATAAAVALPVAGKTVMQTVGLAGVGGPAMFMAERQTIRTILENADHSALAADYDPFDATGLALNTLIPLGFGGIVHGVRSARGGKTTTPPSAAPSPAAAKGASAGPAAPPKAPPPPDDVVDAARVALLNQHDVDLVTGAEAAQPAAGMVRMYHGGDPEAPGPLWFSKDRAYAEGYATKDGRNASVWYVDIPANHPLIADDPQFGTLGPTNVELPADLANGRRILRGPTPEAMAAHVAGREEAANKMQAGETVAGPRVRQVDTPEFKAWFGDSKVPGVVYHGTAADFDAFDAGKARNRNTGLYFTSSPNYAGAAAGVSAQRDGGAANIMPVFLSMQNPLDMSKPSGLVARVKAAIAAASESPEAKQLREAVGPGAQYISEATRKDLKAQGYDGVITDTGAYVVFEPTQVKSAIGNSGRFDPRNPDITDRPAATAAASGPPIRTAVVDSTGAPKLMFHGTERDFSTFSGVGLGDHFTASSEVASGFAGKNGGRVLPVYLEITNPVRIDDHGGSHTNAERVAKALVEQGILPKDYVDEAFYGRLMEGNALANEDVYRANNTRELESIRAELESQGYDGVVYDNKAEGGGDAYIAFRPEQVKPAFNAGAGDAAAGPERVLPVDRPADSPLDQRGGEAAGGSGQGRGPAQSSGRQEVTQLPAAEDPAALRGAPEQDTNIKAALQAIESRGDFEIELEDGSRVSARQAMQDAADAVAQAETESKAFAAAVECALGAGT